MSLEEQGKWSRFPNYLNLLSDVISCMHFLSDARRQNTRTKNIQFILRMFFFPEQDKNLWVVLVTFARKYVQSQLWGEIATTCFLLAKYRFSCRQSLGWYQNISWFGYVYCITVCGEKVVNIIAQFPVGEGRAEQNIPKKFCNKLVITFNLLLLDDYYVLM